MELKQILQHFNIPFKQAGEHHHARAGWLQIDCPFCSKGSQRFRMGLVGVHANCWSCGQHSLVKTLMEITDESYHQLRTFVDDLPKGEGESTILDKGLKHRKLRLPNGVGKLLRLHKVYLRGRALDPHLLVQLWGIQGTGNNPGGISWAIFIPIIYQGSVVSWTCRSIGKTGGRYTSASPDEESLNHKELLFGEDYCRHSCVVCEGPISAMSIGPGAVATFGLTYTKAQLLRISRFPVRAICFDNEPVAQQVARKLCRELEVFPGKTHNIKLSYKDANEVLCKKPKEIKQLRKEFLE